MPRNSVQGVIVLVDLIVADVSIIGQTKIVFGTSNQYILKCESEVILTFGLESYSWNGVFPNADRENSKGLIGLSVLDSWVTEDGRLEVEFANNTSLSVLPSREYESWQLIGPNGFMVVSLAGGKLSEWTPTDS